MLCDEKCEVSVLGMLVLALVAVSVYGNNSVRVLVYDRSVRIHAERAHLVAELLCPVNYLAFVKLVGQVVEYNGGEFDSHADVNSV